VVPEISVIIPTRNRPDLVRQAVESVLVAGGPLVEVIVCDDASDEPASFDHPQVCVIRSSVNVGCSAARNMGLAAARGNVVAFCDDDDVVTEGRFADLDLVAAMTTVVCRRAGFDEHGIEGEVPHPPGEMLASMTPSLGQLLVPRALAPLFDERLPAVEDVDWLIRLSERGCRFEHVQTLGYLVRRHDGIRDGNGDVERLAASRTLLAKHHEYFVAHRDAAAYRWERIAILSWRLGQPLSAVPASLRAFRRGPGIRRLLRLLRIAFVTGRTRPRVS
jgi:glycosyltransferase involved in cell wall biosynthesis